MKEQAILVTPDFDSLRTQRSADQIQELEELAKAAGLKVLQNLHVKQKEPNAALLIGRGKAEELRALVKKDGADVIVFANDLSSSQQRNLEEIVGTKTIDRTQLILDIFAQRAKSMEGKVQVELAQIKYLLPRLSGKGIYLSRLGGGVGTRGPGEQKLEVDRRRIRERIERLTQVLKELQKTRASSIAQKKEKNFPIIALVGYTNAGKSSLFNLLTKSDAIVKNQLFSTLDTTTRLAEFSRHQKALLVDTVGFVRELPHHLVESFKATLEEAVYADILLHVMDAGREDIDAIEKAVSGILKDLGADGSKIIFVLNKSDLLTADQKNALQNKFGPQAVLVSVKTGEGIETLLNRMRGVIFPGRQERQIFIPQSKFNLLPRLYECAEVISRHDNHEGVLLHVRITEQAEKQFLSKLA